MIFIYLIKYDFYLFFSVSKSMEYLRSLHFVKKHRNIMLDYYVGNTFYFKCFMSILYPFNCFIKFSKVYSFGN